MLQKRRWTMLKDYRIRGKGFTLKNRLWGLGLLIIFSLLYLSLGYGAEYPTKTIQIVNPHAPGGPADVTARMLSPKLSAILGQPVLVVSRTGGGGTIGIQSVATGAADGYTLLIAGPTLILAPFITRDISFSLKDFTPINLTVDIPDIFLVKKDAPWQTFEELISYAKKNPGKLTCSGGGPGNVTHFELEQIKMATGTDITYVPMEGAAQATIALVGGHVDMNSMAYQGCKSYLESGSLRALMVVSDKRLKELPDVQTVGEKGYPNVVGSTWLAFYVPAKTPGAVVKRLGEVFNEVLRDKEMIGMMEKVGSAPVVNLGPEEAAKFLKERQQRFSEVVKAGRIGKK
jgi:tripartite-type tricarboxylate transporter receptor subunit TctC